MNVTPTQLMELIRKLLQLINTLLNAHITNQTQRLDEILTKKEIAFFKIAMYLHCEVIMCIHRKLQEPLSEVEIYQFMKVSKQWLFYYSQNNLLTGQWLSIANVCIECVPIIDSNIMAIPINFATSNNTKQSDRRLYINFRLNKGWYSSAPCIPKTIPNKQLQQTSQQFTLLTLISARSQGR